MIYTLLISYALLSQSRWAKALGGMDDDYAYSVSSIQGGGFLVAGATRSFGAGNWDLLILNLATDGSLNWAKTFGGNDDDFARYGSLSPTHDGGFAVAGWTTSFGGDPDILIIKFASNGSLIWARKFGGPSGDFARSILSTQDGGLIVVGSTKSFGAGEDDFFVLKLESNGSLSWAKTFGGNGYDIAYSLSLTHDGGFVIAGQTTSFGAGGWDILVLKLTSDGSLEWAKTFGGPKLDCAFSLSPARDNGFILAGETFSFGMGEDDFFVLKLESDGSLSWAKTFGGPSGDEAYCVCLNNEGEFIVAGWTNNFGVGNSDLLVLNLASDGSLKWSRTFGGLDYDGVFSVSSTQDGGFILAGSTASFGVGNEDFLLLKLDQNGDYPGCIQDCSPDVTDATPSYSSVSLGAYCSPNSSSPSLTVDTYTPTITQICLPILNEEKGGFLSHRITCFSVPGGALFISPEENEIRIYKSDGRLVYSGKLMRGENRINLETGVYLWQTHNQKGKAVVK